MIAQKILPAFYVLELEGEAARIDFLLDKNYGVEKIRFGSLDFKSDLDAARAGQDAINFFLDSPSLKTDNIVETVDYNPSFFPSLDPIVLTEEQLVAAEELHEQTVQQAGAGDKTVVTMTNHFDSLGDFIVARVKSKGDNFGLTMRVAVNPQLFLKEKSEELENQLVVNPHRELLKTATTLH